MVHLEALPGAPLFKGLQPCAEKAVNDAKTIEQGGFSAIMIENFGDTPFFPGRVPTETVAAFTHIAGQIKREVNIPIGINVLRNDGLSALAIAKAVGAEFVRINILTGSRVTDQGLISANAHEILRYRKSLDAENIKIFADIDVKHSAPIAKIDLETEIEDTVKRGLADALVVSGAGTGKPVDQDFLKSIKNFATVPVYIGSGANKSNIKDLLRTANGAIIGSSLKPSISEPIDLEQVKKIARAAGIN